jgi:NSS family neurotransmitter:Na+ symporter
MKDSGPASTGLTFVWMPQLFAQMAGGRAVAVLFFLGLSCAALSSLVSMVELATRTLVDAGLERRKALLVVVVVGSGLGLPSALDVDFLSNQDFVWGVGLIISGAFIAAAVIRHGPARLARDVLMPVTGDWRVGRGWRWAIGMLVPLQALALLAWWIYLSASSYSPETWYNPLDPYSVATCVVQWGIAIVVAMLAAQRLLRRG